jgi:hypothetical protein
MRFEDQDGKRRLLDLANMKVSDAKEFYLQVEGKSQKDVTKLKQRIKDSQHKDSTISLLTIKTKEGKVIGMLEIFDMQYSAYLTISIPNERMSYKYGEEAIDQFLKICKEKQLFKCIEIEKDNEIAQRYVRSHSLENFLVAIA